MTTPLASLVIRTYNRAEILPKALKSALAQDWPATEVIVVDDGSTDHTRQVVEAFPAVTYHYQENQGLQGARATGRRLAGGEFIAYLDSDDTWEPRFLSASIEAMQRFDAGFSFCEFQQFEASTGAPLPSSPHSVPLLREHMEQADPAPLPLPYLQARHLFLSHLPATTSSFAFRRQFFDLAWNGRMVAMDDVGSIIEMILRHQVSGVFLPEPLMNKWCYPSSICDGDRGRRWEMFWHANDYGILLRNFGSLMTPAERRPWVQEVAEHNFSLGYLSACDGDLPAALRHYCRSFAAKPDLKTLLAICKAPAGLLRSRRAASESLSPS